MGSSGTFVDTTETGMNSVCMEAIEQCRSRGS
jgi:hypothetical protein